MRGVENGNSSCGRQGAIQTSSPMLRLEPSSEPFNAASASRLGVSNSLLPILLLVASLGCTLASFLIHATMITAINRKLDAHSQISCLNRDFLGTFKLHRQLYPESTRRMAVILSLGLSVAFGLGFTFIQSLQH
jgi:hypothetical protein